MSLANDLTTGIIDFIYRNGGYAWRAQSTGLYSPTSRSYRYGPKKGVADVIGLYKSVFIACEVKIGKDHLSPEQDGFLKNIEHCGGIVIVARSMDDFERQWEEQLTKRFI